MFSTNASEAQEVTCIINDCVTVWPAKSEWGYGSPANSGAWPRSIVYRDLVDTLAQHWGLGILPCPIRTLILKNSASISGFNLSKLALGGMTPASKIIIVLIILATPLAPSRWPIFDFTAPLKHVREPSTQDRKQFLHASQNLEAKLRTYI